MFFLTLITFLSLTISTFLLPHPTEAQQLSAAEKAELCGEYADSYEDANRELAWLELHIDPFNASTLHVTAAATVGSNWRLEKLIMLEHMRSIGCDTSVLYSGPWAYSHAAGLCVLYKGTDEAIEKCDYLEWEPNENLRDRD